MDGLTHSYPQILQLLRLYISHLYTLRFEAATCARAVILLCRYVVWFINFLSDDQHQTLGNVVSWAIVDLFSFGRKAPAIIQLYQEHLQPVLQAAVENKPEIFTGDLQVSVASRYVSSLTLEQKIIVYFLGVYSTDSTLLNTAPPTLDDIDLGEFLLQVLPSNGDGPNNLPHSRKRLRYSDADAPPTDDPRTILGKRIFKIIKLTFDPDSDALKLALSVFQSISR